ncbi:hypothetical protein QD357_30890, partial [Rhizobium sp. BR 317]
TREEHESDKQTKKSGIGVGSGGGFISIYGSHDKTISESSTDNIGSTLTAANGNVTLNATKGDLKVLLSVVSPFETNLMLFEALTVEITCVIISTPNTGSQSNSSTSLGFSFTGGTIGKTDGQDLLTASNVGTALGGLTLGGVQPGFGSGKGSTNWIDTPAGLYSTGDQNITVGKNTNLTAAGLISTDGQVNLDTGTLTWSDFVGSQKYQGYQVNADIDLYGGKDANGITQNNSSAEGKYQLDDVEQSVKATISGSGGAGNITIRNPDQQAALEQSGQTGTPAQINTDPTQQNVVTKDKHIDLEPYISVQSLQAAVDAGQTLIEAIGSAFDKMLADGKISPEENTSAHKILLNLKDPNVREAIANCAKQASGTACSGTGGLTSDMAQDILGTTRNAGKVTVVTSEDQVTITELTGMDDEDDTDNPYGDVTKRGILAPPREDLSKNFYGENIEDRPDFILSPRTVDDIVGEGQLLPRTGGMTTQIQKSGGFDQAVTDFDSLGLKNVRDISMPNGGSGKVGELPDGTMVVVRSISSENRPGFTSQATLEIQYPTGYTKIRY